MPSAKSNPFLNRLAWPGLPTALLGLLTTALLGCSTPATGPAQSAPPRYRAVIDAGSSGSRLHLYQSQPDGRFVTVRELFSNAQAPHPLSWYDGRHGPGSEPSQAGPEGVQSLLKRLQNHLQAQGMAPEQVPVELLATAGMRLVPPATADSIYASVRQAIQAQGFTLGEVRTLSGQDEGLYAWVDVNYLQGRFHRREATEGVVEIGGASAQVAFALPQAPTEPSPQVRVLDINGARYPVLAVSYLGLGQNQARLAMLQHPASGGTEANVCYPRNPESTPARYSADLPGWSVLAAGGRYSAACRSVYEEVVQQTSADAPNAYPVQQLLAQPGFAQTRFVGLSSVYYAFKDWGALTAAQPATTLQTALDQRCGGPAGWPQVLAQYHHHLNSFSQNACANGSFVWSLLYSPRALGLREDQLKAQGRVQGQEPSWTRGWMVMQAGR
ncbi:hypothetical protein PSQ20_06485 [Curvibacter sp. RS43]|uniref:hypothetical protein n=1 Tax=Curvibacter microcysteis TaxID=3026419 RepID=UPI00235EF534|nr:hypothetical protein [Curvibacter sp. RS43]MDD0809975.1 hypothetical protein [Curvibacter sp. RS43]